MESAIGVIAMAVFLSTAIVLLVIRVPYWERFVLVAVALAMVVVPTAIRRRRV